MSALSVTRRYVYCSVEFGRRSVHRFGKPLIMQVFQRPALLSRAGVSLSALLLLHSGGGSAMPNRRQCAPSCSP